MKLDRKTIPRFREILFLFAILSGVCFAEPELTIVIDLDYTLIFTDARTLDPEKRAALDANGATVSGAGKYYRLAHGTREFVLSLMDLGPEGKVQVGVFSAHRNTQRTEEVSHNLWRTRRASFVSPFSFVLGYASVDKWEDIFSLDYWKVQPESSIFVSDTKKDLTKIPGRGKSILLIDDSPGVSIRGQEKSLVWVRNRTVDGELARIRALIDLAMQVAKRDNISIEEAMWKIQWKRLPGGTLEYNAAICEHPTLYLRGMEIFREVNPRFELHPSYLAAVRPPLDSRAPPMLFPPAVIPELFIRRPPPPPARVALPLAIPARSSIGSLFASLFLPPPEPVHAVASLVGQRLNRGQLIQVGEAQEKVRDLHKESEHTRLYIMEPRGAGFQRALKIARNQSRQALAELADEQKLFAELAARDLPHARVIETGPGYVVREWIPGSTAEEWLAKWTAAGGPGEDPKAIALNKLLTELTAKNIYLTQLRPKDVIWNGQRWIIVNAGEAKSDLSARQVWHDYRDRFQRRWGLQLQKKCKEILASLPKP